MAIYHLTAQALSRKDNRSATASAAYRSGDKIHDQRSQKTHDYTRRKGVVFSEIIAPDHTPDWMHDRAQLWNAVEQAEKRKDSCVAREVEVALPRELDTARNTALLHGFIAEQFTARGIIVDVAMHESQARDGKPQPHAHILFTTREITAHGLGKKNRDVEGNQRNEVLKQWRQAWEAHVNRALADTGETARVDHRTLEIQGLDRLPEPKIGVVAHAMEQCGTVTDRGAFWQEVDEHTTLRAQLDAFYAKTAQTLKALESFIKSGQEVVQRHAILINRLRYQDASRASRQERGIG